MSLVTANGLSVVEATINLPRVGVWHAELRVDSIKDIAGPISIEFGNQTFLGTAHTAGLSSGSAHIRVAGGKGTLKNEIASKSYINVPVSIPVRDAITDGGEQFAETSDAQLLARSVTSWTRTQGPGGAALLKICAHINATWRMKIDGSIWVGVDSWPLSTIKDFDLVSESPQSARIEIGSIDPTILPGETFKGRKVSYVMHTVTDSKVRSAIWFET